MAEQLIQKNCNTGVGTNIYPITTFKSVFDSDTDKNLDQTIEGFNHVYLPFKDNSIGFTRLQVPDKLRRKGLWITYLTCDNNLVTEWYNSNDFSDGAWRNSNNWMGLSDITSKDFRPFVGKPLGLAPLDGSSKVPAEFLPSYVDDVLEFDNKESFPETGESGKIYVDKSTSRGYRWSGTTYTFVGNPLELGTTVGTAYPGDKGKEVDDRSNFIKQLEPLGSNGAGIFTDRGKLDYNEDGTEETVSIKFTNTAYSCKLQIPKIFVKNGNFGISEVNLPEASSTSAGTITADDYKKIGLLNKGVFRDISIYNNPSKIVMVDTCFETYRNGVIESYVINHTLPFVSQTSSGVLSPNDYSNFINVYNLYRGQGIIYNINAVQNNGQLNIIVNKSIGSATIPVPTATNTNNGAMSSTDKANLDNIIQVVTSPLNNTDQEWTDNPDDDSCTLEIGYKKLINNTISDEVLSLEIPYAKKAETDYSGTAGLMSIQDKTDLDDTTTKLTNFLSDNAEKLWVDYPEDNKASIEINYDPNENDFCLDIPYAFSNPSTGSRIAGLMSAEDKKRLDHISSLYLPNFNGDGTAVDVNSFWNDKLEISFYSQDLVNEESIGDRIFLPAARYDEEAGYNTGPWYAGVMSGEDKRKLEELCDSYILMNDKQDPDVIQSANNIAINMYGYSLNSEESINNNIVLPTATSTTAGIMSAQDKSDLSSLSEEYIREHRILRGKFASQQYANTSGDLRPSGVAEV